MSTKSNASAEFDEAALRYHQCERKRKYTTLSEAQRAVSEMALRQKEDPALFHVYYCNYCAWLHVGHLPKVTGLHMARIRKKYKREVKKRGEAT